MTAWFRDATTDGTPTFYRVRDRIRIAAAGLASVAIVAACSIDF